jgi:excisionase family DNA binding protein
MKDIDLLILREAAEKARIKLSTMRSWRAQRRLPFYKLGGRVLVSRADLEQFIAASRIPAVERKVKP